MEIQNEIFEPVRSKLDEKTDEPLSISLLRSEVTNTGGDVETVATHEGITPKRGDGWHLFEQTTIKIVNENGAFYAEAIYKQFTNTPEVTLLEWIEIVDTEHQNSGLGRMLLERTIDHIEATTQTKYIYTKVENTFMISPNIDCGFVPIDISKNETWHKLTL